MIDSDAKPEIDIGTFWKAVGLRATGAVIATSANAEGPAGLLALSATHLCAAPPMMMLAIGKTTSALQQITESGCFALNYPAKGQEELVDVFGGRHELKGADRFTKGTWGTLTTGAPILMDGVGALDCRLEEIIERHGTLIAIGRVVDYVDHASAAPLILYRGKPF